MPNFASRVKHRELTLRPAASSRRGRMSATRALQSWVISTAMCGVSWAGAAEPGRLEAAAAGRQLLDQVRARYRSAQTYQAKGQAVTVIVMPRSSVETSVHATFSIKLARPNYYRIEWVQHLAGAATRSGAVWNDGEGPKFYRDATGTAMRMESDLTALSAATGDSMGVSYSIPMLFFPFNQAPDLLNSLREVEALGTQTIAGESCSIVSGSLENGIVYRLWIATNDHHIVQMENTLGGQLGGYTIDELSVEQETRALRAAGRRDTEENRAWIRESLRQARELVATVRGLSRQIHTEVDMIRPISTEAFSFSKPEGAK